jgi:predicted cupin superfamily sugar epimerase
MTFSATQFIQHPEGGRFREVFRSERTVTQPDGQEKCALTHIYFQLKKGEISRFHRVAQEEVWNLYEGKEVRLYIVQADGQKVDTVRLSAESRVFCTVIPANHWFAAEPMDSDVLVGCTVAPGFEFEDFELLSAKDPLCHSLKDQGLGQFF